MVDISDAELCNRISERLFKYREATAEQILAEVDRLIDIEQSTEAADIERGKRLRVAVEELMSVLEEG